MTTAPSPGEGAGPSAGRSVVGGLLAGAHQGLDQPDKEHGGVVASALGTGDIWELNIVGAIVAIVAAVLLVGLVETLMGSSKKAAHR